MNKKKDLIKKVVYKCLLNIKKGATFVAPFENIYEVKTSKIPIIFLRIE